MPGDRRLVVPAAIPVGFLLVALLGLPGREFASEFGQLLAAAWCARQVWAARPSADVPLRQAWTLLGAAAACWAASHGVYAAATLVPGDAVPAFGDLGYFLCLPLCLAGLLRLVATPIGWAARLIGLLEGILIVASVLTIGWALVLHAVFEQAEGSTATKVLALVFPLGDVLIASVLLFVAGRTRPGSRRPLAVIGLGLVLFLVGDLAYLVASLGDGYRSGAVMDAWWMVGWLVVATAGHRADVRAPERLLGEGAVARWSHLFVVGPAAVAASVGLVTLALRPEDGALRGLVAVVVAGVIGHQLAAVQERARLTTYLEDEVEVRTRDLARREEYFRSLVSQSSEVVIVLEADLRVRLLTSLESALGYRADAFLGRHAFALVVREDVPALDAALHLASTRPGQPVSASARTVHADGTVRSMDLTVVSLLHDPAVEGVVVTAKDVTERDALQRRLAHQAYHDELTGLPNRALFRQRVDEALDHRHGEVAVLFVDLDGFKAVNDALGHTAGDTLLASFARRLRSVVPDAHTVARLGGDEFAVVVAAGGMVEARLVADRVLRALNEPVVVEGRELPVAASVGVASTATATTGADLLRDADAAMYHAKARGRSRVEVFTPEMHADALDRLELEGDLRRAVARSELRLEYQPLVELATGRVTGAEALVRWDHPGRGLVPPARFVPIAEEIGAIVDVGRWVLAEASREARGWRRVLGDDAPRMSVNVSARQLADDRFADDAIDTVLAAGARPEWLVLELTESVLVSGDPLTRLRELRAAGFRIAIDDFGTGYSALSYLHRLPVDELKIDRAFVQVLEAGGEDVGLVRMIVELGRSLGLVTVAEGVETEAQRAILAELGCDLAQGYLFARPGPAEAVVALAGQSSSFRQRASTKE